jgi:hypothetical protein
MPYPNTPLRGMDWRACDGEMCRGPRGEDAGSDGGVVGWCRCEDIGACVPTSAAIALNLPDLA